MEPDRPGGEHCENIPARVRRGTATLAAVAEPTRLGLLLLIADGSRDVAGLCAELNSPQPRVSKHLGRLRNAGLVEGRPVGTRVFYRPTERGLAVLRLAEALFAGATPQGD